MDENKLMEMFAQLLQGQTELKLEMQGVRVELKEDIQGVRTELKEDIQGVRAELKEDIQDVSAKLKEDIQSVSAKLKEDIQSVKDSQLRMENKFDKQISALHDLRVSQDKANQENLDNHTTFSTKIEELQFEARITDGKLDEIAEDVSYLAKKSFRHEKKLLKL